MSRKCYECDLITCTFAGYNRPACAWFEEYSDDAEELYQEECVPHTVIDKPVDPDQALRGHLIKLLRSDHA
jgi:hypothetical protein